MPVGEKAAAPWVSLAPGQRLPVASSPCRYRPPSLDWMMWVVLAPLCQLFSSPCFPVTCCFYHPQALSSPSPGHLCSLGISLWRCVGAPRASPARNVNLWGGGQTLAPLFVKCPRDRCSQLLVTGWPLLSAPPNPPSLPLLQEDPQGGHFLQPCLTPRVLTLCALSTGICLAGVTKCEEMVFCHVYRGASRAPSADSAGMGPWL